MEFGVNLEYLQSLWLVALLFFSASRTSLESILHFPLLFSSSCLRILAFLSCFANRLMGHRLLCGRSLSFLCLWWWCLKSQQCSGDVPSKNGSIANVQKVIFEEHLPSGKWRGCFCEGFLLAKLHGRVGSGGLSRGSTTRVASTPHRAMSNLKCKQVLCKHAHCYAQFKPEPKWSMRSVYHSSSFTSWLCSPLYLVGVIQQMLFCFKLNNFSQPLLCGLLRGLGSRFIQPKGMVSLHCVYRELVVRGSFQDGENLFADVQEVS